MVRFCLLADLTSCFEYTYVVGSLCRGIVGWDCKTRLRAPYLVSLKAASCRSAWTVFGTIGSIRMQEYRSDSNFCSRFFRMTVLSLRMLAPAIW